MSLQVTPAKMTSTEVADDVNDLQNDDSNRSEVSQRSKRSRKSSRSLAKSELSVKSESLSVRKAALQVKKSFQEDHWKLLQQEVEAQQRRNTLRQQQIALTEQQEQEELKQKILAMKKDDLATRQELAEIDAVLEMSDDEDSEKDIEISFKGVREENKSEGMQRFFDSQEKLTTPPHRPDEQQTSEAAPPSSNPVVPWDRIASSLEGCLSQLTKVAIEQSAASNQLAVSSQLPRIDVPVFSGDPLKYTLWKNAFDCMIDSKPVSEVTKLNYLNAYVSGKAKEIVEHHLLIGAEDGYQEAIRQLEMRFGDPSTIGVSYSRKLSSWPKITSRDAAGLRDFADFLQKVLAAKRKVQSLGILDFPQENVKLVEKLPGHLEGRWRDEIDNWRSSKGTQSYPTFSVFAEFVRRAADRANIPELEPLTKEHKPNLPASQTKARIFATSGYSDDPSSYSEVSYRAKHGPYSSCPYCEGGHPIDACDSFMEEPIEARKVFFRRKMLCLGCGTTDEHLIKNCQNRKSCKACKKPHLTCLHFHKTTSDKVEVEEATSHCTSASAVPDQDGKIYSMIVPVWVRRKEQPSKETLEYAILDDQSNVSFVSKRLCEKLDVKGEKTSLLLTTMHETANIESERVSGLEVLDFNRKNVIQLPTTFSRDSVRASRSQIPKPDVVKQWEHLRDMAADMMPYREDVEVSLLIGSDCTRAIRPREIITGGEDEPYAQKSLLGWGVVGSKTPENKTRESTYSNFAFQAKAKEVPLPKGIIQVSADDASRGPTTKELLESSRWLSGLAFLQDGCELKAPCQNQQVDMEGDPKAKRASTLSSQSDMDKLFQSDQLSYLSTWHRTRRKGWRRDQHLADEFLQRWKKDFPSQLQTSQKWIHPKKDVKEGDIVISKEGDVRSGVDSKGKKRQQAILVDKPKTNW